MHVHMDERKDGRHSDEGVHAPLPAAAATVSAAGSVLSHLHKHSTYIHIHAHIGVGARTQKEQAGVPAECGELGAQFHASLRP